MKNYLKDQGGQFWGAFTKSYAKTIKEERERPLKEAMMKAQIGQAEAVAKKAQHDVQQALEQDAAVKELSNILQTGVPTQAPAGPQLLPNEAAGETAGQPEQTVMKAPEMTDPRIRGALLKSGVKGEVLSQAAKSAFPSGTMAAGGNAIVNSWEEARKLSNDPEFQAANPYGGRWEVNQRGQIQFKGIHPVNPEAAIFHGGGGRQGAVDYAYDRSASAGAGGYAGRTGQEIQQPIAPRQPFAGQQPQQQSGWQGNTYVPPGYQQPVTAPGYTGGGVSVAPVPGGGANVQQVPGGATQPLPGETPEATKQRIRKAAQVGATPLPEPAQQAQAAASKITAQADMLLKGFSPQEIDEFAGVYNQPKQKIKSHVQAGAKALGMGGPLDQGQRDRFSAWQVALGQLKQVAFDTGGKQLTPFEAQVVFSYVPTGNELNGGTEVKQKIDNLKAFLKAGAEVRLKLAREGRLAVDPAELDSIMQQELAPVMAKLQAGQPKASDLPPPPKGWK